MKNVIIGLFGCFILSSVVMAGAGVAAEAKSVTDDRAQKRVAALYLKNCSICHGDKGDANTRAQSGMFPKPRDFTTAQAAIELTRKRMILSVAEGRPNTAMVAHKGRISETDIAALVDYIRLNFMQIPVAKEGGQPESVSLGEKVYSKHCAVCHGDNGSTAYWAKSGLNPPPRDFTATKSQSVLTRERMIKSVTEGRPKTGMMPFTSRLSKDDIAAVVTFIRFKFMGVDPDSDTGAAPLAMMEPVSQKSELTSLSSSTSSPMSLGGIPGVDIPLSAARSQISSAPAMSAMQNSAHQLDVDMSSLIPNGLKGDVEWGRDFYLKNCYVCHGITGTGDGPRAFFNIPPPRDFTSENSRLILNKPRIFESITKGRARTVMPAWGQVLSPQEIANLTEFVFKTFIQPVRDNNKKKAL